VSNPEADACTAAAALRQTRDQLSAAGIEDAAVEAELLLRQALRSHTHDLPSRASLYQRLRQPLGTEALAALAALAQRRLKGEPTAYITGVREFRGLDFEVTPDVLIPRPETELLVDKAVEWVTSNALPGASPVIADIGTGSGAVAVALAKEIPGATLLATDISRDALATARRNARRHGVERRITFLHGDLLLPVHCYVDLIVANLPYVTDRDWAILASEVRDHEPAVALLGGEDGLALIRSLLQQAHRYLQPGGGVFLEFGAGQKDCLTALAQRLFPRAKIEVAPDFAGIPRALSVST
jgi:release factor glutamine methyltransferase